MAFSFNKLKNILNSNRDSQLAGSGSLDPEIGFKLALHPVSKNLYVTVIGARHLPSFFGLSRAHGYLVKVIIYCSSIYKKTIDHWYGRCWHCLPPEQAMLEFRLFICSEYYHCKFAKYLDTYYNETYNKITILITYLCRYLYLVVRPTYLANYLLNFISQGKMR